VKAGGKVTSQPSIDAPVGDGDDGGAFRHPVEPDNTCQVTIQTDVRQALSALPLEQTLVLQAKADGKTLAEIAEEQGLSVGQVRGLLSKAKDTMRKLLAAHAPTTAG